MRSNYYHIHNAHIGIIKTLREAENGMCLRLLHEMGSSPQLHVAVTWNGVLPTASWGCYMKWGPPHSFMGLLHEIGSSPQLHVAVTWNGVLPTASCGCYMKWGPPHSFMGLLHEMGSSPQLHVAVTWNGVLPTASWGCMYRTAGTGVKCYFCPIKIIPKAYIYIYILWISGVGFPGKCGKTNNSVSKSFKISSES